MHNLILIFLFLILASVVSAEKILEVSATKKTIVLDAGSLDGIEVNSESYLAVEVGEELPKIIPIASGRAVKVQSNFSFWYLSPIEASYLLPGMKIRIYQKDEVLNGRAPFKIKEKRVVLARGQNKKEWKGDEGREIPKVLVINEDKYLRGPKLVDKFETRWENHREYDFREWQEMSREADINREDNKITASVGSKDLLKSSDNGELREKLTDEVYDSTVNGSIVKHNSLRKGIKQYEYDQNIKDFESRDNTFGNWVASHRHDNYIKERAIQKAVRDENFYSADFTDEELRRYFVETGVLIEKIRRRWVLTHAVGHEVLIGYTTGLVDQTVTTDMSNRATLNLLDLGYEYHLGRLSETYEHFSVDFFYRYGINNYDGGGMNVHSFENSFKFGTNYYFNDSSAVVNKIAAYCGAGISLGTATISKAGFSTFYDYKLLTFPFSLGIKYKFYAGDEYDEYLKLGFGMHANLIYEIVNLTSAETISDVMRGKMAHNDFRFQIGINIFF